MQAHALVDANNFYATCEKIFQPGLEGVPLVVLSNNDGCVVARSNEVKALGVKMGAPWHLLKPLVEQHGGRVDLRDAAPHQQAEHGVGELKAAKLPHYKDPTALAMMRAVKQALDPHNILNPGKSFS